MKALCCGDIGRIENNILLLKDYEPLYRFSPKVQGRPLHPDQGAWIRSLPEYAGIMNVHIYSVDSLETNGTHFHVNCFISVILKVPDDVSLEELPWFGIQNTGNLHSTAWNWNKHEWKEQPARDGIPRHFRSTIGFCGHLRTPFNNVQYPVDGQTLHMLFAFEGEK